MNIRLKIVGNGNMVIDENTFCALVYNTKHDQWKVYTKGVSSEEYLYCEPCQSKDLAVKLYGRVFKSSLKLFIDEVIANSCIKGEW